MFFFFENYARESRNKPKLIGNCSNKLFSLEVFVYSILCGTVPIQYALIRLDLHIVCTTILL